jgi:uncharacterized membrane protein
MSFLNAYVLPLTVLAALGSGLIAGLFFTFSNTIMQALSRMYVGPWLRWNHVRTVASIAAALSFTLSFTLATVQLGRAST